MVRALRGSARISQVATAASVSRATVSRVIAGWRLEGSGAVLEGPGAPLARYELGARMPQVHAPRPYLHPVRTQGHCVVGFLVVTRVMAWSGWRAWWRRARAML